MKKYIFLLFIFFSFQSKSQDTANIFDFIKEWIGVPYKFGGESKRGIDCSKLTQKLYELVYHIQIPRVAWDQWKFTERVKLEDMRLGDIIFFNSYRSPTGIHCGIYLGDGLFLHAPRTGDRVKISCIDEGVYRKTFKGGGRVKM
jgi:lipoprotein Spr